MFPSRVEEQEISLDFTQFNYELTDAYVVLEITYPEKLKIKFSSLPDLLRETKLLPLDTIALVKNHSNS